MSAELAQCGGSEYVKRGIVATLMGFLLCNGRCCMLGGNGRFVLVYIRFQYSTLLIVMFKHPALFNILVAFSLAWAVLLASTCILYGLVGLFSVDHFPLTQ